MGRLCAETRPHAERMLRSVFVAQADVQEMDEYLKKMGVQDQNARRCCTATGCSLLTLAFPATNSDCCCIS